MKLSPGLSTRVRNQVRDSGTIKNQEMKGQHTNKYIQIIVFKYMSSQLYPHIMFAYHGQHQRRVAVTVGGVYVSTASQQQLHNLQGMKQ